MLSGRVLARFSSLKTYLQVRIDLKYGFSPPHVSYQPGTASTVNKERRWELRVWSEHQSTGFLVCSPRPRTHRALLVARDHREMSAPNSKAKDPTGRTEGGRPPPRPRGQGPPFEGRVLTRAPFSAVPGCLAHSTAGPNVAPQCRHRQSAAQDETPCVLWPFLPDVQLPRPSQGHLKEGQYMYSLCF